MTASPPVRARRQARRSPYPSPSDTAAMMSANTTLSRLLPPAIAVWIQVTMCQDSSLSLPSQLRGRHPVAEREDDRLDADHDCQGVGRPVAQPALDADDRRRAIPNQVSGTSRSRLSDHSAASTNGPRTRARPPAARPRASLHVGHTDQRGHGLSPRLRAARLGATKTGRLGCGT